MNPNEPSYPCQELNGQGNPHMPMSYGLTKRERFAMAAMQGLCASTDSMVCFDTAIACYAVQYADALIAELDKEKP